MSLIIIAFTKGVKMSKTIIILPNISICEKHINQNTIITIIAATLMNAIESLHAHVGSVKTYFTSDDRLRSRNLVFIRRIIWSKIAVTTSIDLICLPFTAIRFFGTLSKKKKTSICKHETKRLH